jgi:hypothetical protein
MSVIPFVAFNVALALAGTPLVLEGVDGDTAVGEVSSRTGLPADQLEPLDIASLLDAPPQVVGAAVLRRCVRDTVGMESVRAELARAEAARRSGDPVGALDHLDLAVAGLGCLSELVDRPVAARIFLQRGAILAGQGELEGARSELRTALSFDPSLPWDAGLPVEGQALIEEERERSRGHRITALPSKLVSGPWLGGALVPEGGSEAAEGLVLVQYASPAGIRSAWMVVSGHATLVIPGAYRRPVLEGMAQPGARHEVEALLAATLPDFAAAYLHEASGGTWLVVEQAGALETTELVPAAPPEEPEAPRGRWWQRP